MAPRKRSLNAAQRGWGLLRLALLWVRKGGLLKALDLRMLGNCINKRLNHSGSSRKRMIEYYGEREYSLDSTPIINIRRMKGRVGRNSTFRMMIIPCMSSADADSDYDIDRNDDFGYGKGLYGGDYRGERSLMDDVGNDVEEQGAEDWRSETCTKVGGENSESGGVLGVEEDDDDHSVDVKADVFIAKFYEQLRLQRQRSHIRFQEMINRGAS